MIATNYGYGQENIVVNDSIDTKYREDQFYIGVNYNVLLNKPGDARTRGLSGGIHFGYLRDMPINKQRNVALALGLGLSFDEYGQTVFIGETLQDKSIYTVLDDDDVAYDRNRFSMSTIEIPFQLRWRSSTAETYKFWRIYAGVRLGYTYWYKAAFKQPGNNVNQTDISEFNRMRLGASFSFGYNTVNFYAHYAITPLFTGAVTTNGESVDMTPLKLGLIFYIL
ncbi:hypothetical protein ULMS_06800 [Patiriisocius marinistellae]|uniref:Outer membrane protein beta-barrel domain-containing protein n=1 Tax=Patiriisocius marinistellae TaxID=2494560 RepID=A0A5J4FVP1_9FLAO|nr:hypothetical protein ULMS_06800 [Patiriisocius marinistellae]